MKVVKKLVVAFDLVNDWFTVFAGFLLVFAAAGDIVGIITRSLGRPVAWIFEVCSFVLLYICFLVAAWVLRKEGHVGIDFVVLRFRPRVQSLFHTVTSAISAVACFVITWYGAKATLSFYISGYFVVSVLEPPKWVFLIIIPIGSFLLGVQFVRRAYNHLKKWRAPLEEVVKRELREL